jgi:hypothetical protein
MTKKTFYALIAEVEESLEGYPNAQLIISIGRCSNEIAMDKGWPLVEILASYVNYVSPFLNQGVMEEVFQ